MTALATRDPDERADEERARRTKAAYDAARTKLMLAVQAVYFDLLGEVPMDRSCVEFCEFADDVLTDQVSSAQWALWEEMGVV